MRVLVVGDMHLDDVYQGSHKDYLSNCRWAMDRVVSLVQETSPTHLVFLGDVIGVNKKKFRSRDFFLEVYSWLNLLNSSVDVLSVKGNHDHSNNDSSEFDVFVALGLIQRPSFIDFPHPSGESFARFHFVDYGHEADPLSTHKGINIAFGHNDFGGTPNPDPVELGNNFSGVSLLVSGHIHTPIPPTPVTLPDGNIVSLMYPGCPTRVAQRYSDCSALVFDWNGDMMDYTLVPFGLPPVEETFYDIPSEEELIVSSMNEDNMEALKGIVGSLRVTDNLTVSLVDQIESRQDVSPKVKTLAVDFLKKALEVE